jgi:hypothetical protein
MMSDRWTYDAIRWQKLSIMYEARRSILKHSREWLHPIEDVGVAYDDQGRGKEEGMPDLYYLMDSVIFLILAAGKSPEPGLTNATNEIQTILAKTPLEEILNEVPEDEARELRLDLEILKLIPATMLTLPMSQWTQEERDDWDRKYS